ncbi:MAG: TIGR03067 domain-containing protein, partial [Gemmataceae bacterium]
DAIPEEALKMIKFTITDDRFIIDVAGKAQEALFKINPGKEPKEIDVTPQEGPRKDKVGLGIYELNGDTLRICHREGGDGRPSEFKADAKNRDGIITLKRVKKASE